MVSSEKELRFTTASSQHLDPSHLPDEHNVFGVTLSWEGRRWRTGHKMKGLSRSSCDLVLFSFLGLLFCFFSFSDLPTLSLRFSSTLQAPPSGKTDWRYRNTREIPDCRFLGFISSLTPTLSIVQSDDLERTYK